MGPAFAFDADARRAMSKLIENGYVHAVLAGNALATHDLEGAYLKTALGQDIYTQKSMPNGHYNHLDLINRVKFHGSIKKFIENEHIDNGIIYSCEKCGVPYVLGGSIRDDGRFPRSTATSMRRRTPCATRSAAQRPSSAWPPCCTRSPRAT